MRPKNPVRYLCEVCPGTEFRKSPVPRRGIQQLAPGQGEDGYGRRISTDYQAKVNGRWQRVYCCCISNVGSLYVERDGEWLFVRDQDVPESVQNS